MLNERGIAHLEQTRAIGGDEVVGIVERVLCDIHEVAYGQSASLAREQAIGDIGPNVVLVDHDITRAFELASPSSAREHIESIAKEAESVGEITGWSFGVILLDIGLILRCFGSAKLYKSVVQRSKPAGVAIGLDIGVVAIGECQSYRAVVGMHEPRAIAVVRHSIERVVGGTEVAETRSISRASRQPGVGLPEIELLVEQQVESLAVAL